MQHVLESTHVDGNILDLVISRSCEVSVLSFKVSTLASDHHWLHSQVSLDKPQVPRRSVTFRRFKSVDLSAFRLDTSTSEIILQPADTVNQLYNQYNKVMSGLVDAHAPLRTCRVPVRPLVPWYRQDIREAKRVRQCRECTWRLSGLIVHHQMYRVECTAVHNLVRSAKSDFYTSELWKCEGNQRAFYRLMDGLLKCRGNTRLPTHDYLEELDSTFCDFVSVKIQTIRDSLRGGVGHETTAEPSAHALTLCPAWLSLSQPQNPRHCV